MVAINESYKTFDPPPWVRQTVERLLASLKPQHVHGLQAIVLTDSEAIGRGKTQRVGGRKYDRKACRGFYHRASHRQQAWIELVVDSTLAEYPDFLFRFQIFRDMTLGHTLYHEIGHHLHDVVGSAAGGGEESAEDWRRRLSKLHGRRRYWYLRPIRPFLRGVSWLLRRIASLRKSRMSAGSG